MFKVGEHERSFRFGDNGPKYLTKGPNVDVGVVVLKPGQDFQNHYHTTCEEIFYVLEGAIDFYINDHHVPMKQGDMLQVRPTESHYLINSSEQDFKAVFIKSPHIEARDSINVDNPKLHGSEE
ncbi:mannose-6-phosphate isomerase-like protein (cupin superfamily) [Scopulibacillus darangshiensis]|uniref:Mannose-6-phosphate isomerase-like protein (Cupin superfamily) n=1 Tax=Scopulibacillus darangshiensis TaxID=442528 RepID=A0A4R2P435_9BACL|nr:cupin domain-containing protein [Scopulibacillus darangshiensis]TCP29569.1 mannose-6-phosphate isomerase-like protein (cupin superfamily) [Scopulibacillus darangshiensis]